MIRETKESRVEVELELYKSGTADVATGNDFLDHMLVTLAKYSNIDLRVQATGDLEHHLIEDVAITIGQAFKEAHNNAPCARMSYDIIAMDDALVMCALDLVDRPFYAGELPLPIYEHWFRSFAMEARLTLHLDRMRGRDTHHVIEACFKALGRCLAAALEPRADELSTKGSVQVQ